MVLYKPTFKMTLVYLVMKRGMLKSKVVIFNRGDDEYIWKDGRKTCQRWLERVKFNRNKIK